MNEGCFAYQEIANADLENIRNFPVKPSLPTKPQGLIIIALEKR